ncbi:MAG TPA: LysR family transcriptional regulator [Paenibacillus sp.]|nr:LysR family transcriptional regulator [Paenibacillus sp.]
MQLKRLQSFVDIVDRRSFTDAAGALGLTPSALSKQIKALEDELGVALFYRSGGVEPTSAGKLVYERGKAMLAEWDALAAECRSRAGVPSGKLRIGASTVPASYLLPALAKRLIERYPHVELSIVEDGSDAVLARLDQRQIDVAFVGVRRSSPALRFVPVAPDRLVVIAGADAAFAPTAAGEGAAGAPPAWTEAPFVLREEGSGTRQALERALEGIGLAIERLKVAAVSSSTESAMALAEAGVGVTVVSRWALALPRAIATIAELPTDRSFYAVFEANRAEDPMIRLFLDNAAAIYQ